MNKEWGYKMNITIEPMDINSISDVLEISTLSFPVPWSETSLLGELKNPLAKYLVAKDNNKIIGFMGVWLIVDEGHITNIAVHPNYRGYGIGDLLIDGIINLCKNNNCIALTLEVRLSNIIAQNLYKKHGFIEEGIRKKYYEDNGEDAVIMWNHSI